MERNNKIIVLLVLVLIIVIIFLGWLVSRNKFRSNIRSGEFVSGDLKPYSDRLFDLEKKMDEEANTRVKVLGIESEIRKIMQSSPSADDEAHAKLLLARIFIYRFGDNGSVVEGINLAKEIPKYEKYSKIWRAKALEFISNLIRDVPDQDYVDMIWNDTYYKPFQDKDYPDSGGVRNICKASLEIYPLPLCSYRLAGFDLNRLIEDRVFHTLSDEERSDYSNDAKNKIAQAEALLSIYPFPYKNLFDQARISLRRAKRQKEMFLLGWGNSDSLGESEKNFKACMDAYSKGTISMYHSSVYVIYNYVSFLAEVYGEDRISEIKELTNNIAELYQQNPNSAFFVYMRKLKDPSFDNKYISMQVSLLGKMNPEFKKIFLDMGWPEERLNTPYPKLP
jgi:hypothetical protein